MYFLFIHIIFFPCHNESARTGDCDRHMSIEPTTNGS